MREHDIDDILNVIRALQRIEIGDLDRLVRIRNRIMDGDIRQDDIDYVRDTFASIHELRRDNRPVLKSSSSSAWWYILPIFLSIIGGIISYACLRGKDPVRARKTLVLGIIMFGMFVAFIAIAAYAGSDAGDVGESIHRDTTDPEIKDEPLPTVTNESISNSNSEDSHTPPVSRQYESHTISYGNIPDYVDSESVVHAVQNSIHAWESSNPALDFDIIESDADVNIIWLRWMPHGGLGLHTVFNIESETDASHTITIRLGNDDCHSDYQQYSSEALTYIIAHEMGHYLGLRHIDDRDHLMYSGEFVGVDSVFVYDSRGYVVPQVPKPEIMTQNGLDVMVQIGLAEEILQDIQTKRQEIRADPSNSGDLKSNTERYNEVARQIDGLNKELECVELT